MALSGAAAVLLSQKHFFSAEIHFITPTNMEQKCLFKQAKIKSEKMNVGKTLKTIISMQTEGGGEKRGGGESHLN